MANEWPLDLPMDLLQDALSGLTVPLAEPEDDGDDEDDDDALKQVTRGIVATHVDVVARFARAVFGAREGVEDHVQFAEALGSLCRLAEATDDRTLLALLEPMRSAVVARAERGGFRRDRAQFLGRLTAFVDAFAGQLPEADAARLHELVRWEPDRVPLLTELRGVRGIGPRRLKRLYCCGLYTVEAVAHADPGEVASVCGLPQQLSAQVVQAARDFAAQERIRSLKEARVRILDFARMMTALGQPVPDALIQSALAAVDHLDPAAPEAP